MSNFPHISDSRHNLTRHFGFFHKKFDKPEAATILTPTTTTSNLCCLICDDIKKFESPMELHTHWSNSHFREKLLNKIQNVNDERGGFKCPDCDYRNSVKMQVCRQYGLRHNILREMYRELTGINVEAPSPRRTSETFIVNSSPSHHNFTSDESDIDESPTKIVPDF